MKMKFSIRDLLWLTMLVGVTLGWFLNDRAWRRDFTFHVNAVRNENFQLTKAKSELEREVTILKARNKTLDEHFRNMQQSLHDVLQQRAKDLAKAEELKKANENQKRADAERVKAEVSAKSRDE
jgi:hypothetical protein